MIKKHLKTNIMIKKGDILIAIDECVMEDEGNKTLTIGKEYEVIAFFNKFLFSVEDDENSVHHFPFDGYEEYFKLKSK